MRGGVTFFGDSSFVYFYIVFIFKNIGHRHMDMGGRRSTAIRITFLFLSMYSSTLLTMYSLS